MEQPQLVLRPIGFFRSPFRDRVDAPRQPRAAEGTRGTIELLPGHHFEDALCDLEGFEHVWVLFWFHLNRAWRPKVLPPRSETRRGLFATRTPHRPNPLGLSVLRLERVEGLTLHVADVDILDGTPVLDLKPYIAWTDAIPSSRAGWLAADQELPSPPRPDDPRAGYELQFAPRALEQLEFLRGCGVDLETPARRVLSLGPQPHAYRRIKLADDGTGTLAVREWRLRFRAEGRTIEVLGVASGFRADQLEEDAPDRATHRAFVARFGGASGARSG